MKIWELFILRIKEVAFPLMLMGALGHSRYNYQAVTHVKSLDYVVLENIFSNVTSPLTYIYIYI